MSTYNLDSIKEMTGNDEDFVREMVSTFVEEISEDIRAMNEAVEYENAALAYQIAHKMKPNLQLFGLQLLPEIEKLEAWHENGLEKENILPSVKKISTTVSQTIEELKTDFNL